MLGPELADEMDFEAVETASRHTSLALMARLSLPIENPVLLILLH